MIKLVLEDDEAAVVKEAIRLHRNYTRIMSGHSHIKALYRHDFKRQSELLDRLFVRFSVKEKKP